MACRDRAGDAPVDARVEIEARAIGLLARREHSAQELRRKLLERGFVAAEIDEVLEDLRARNLQSDARFTEMFVRQRFSNGVGAQRVRAELAQRGIESTMIAAALTEQVDDPVARAAELLDRRYRRSNAQSQGGDLDPREHQRLMRFLAQRGFDFETARAALAIVASLAADERS